MPAAGGSDALKVLLVDPSRFTTPYDKGLSQGLRQAGIEPVWAVRPIRANEADDLSGEIADQAVPRRPGRARDREDDERAESAHGEAHEQRQREGVLLHLPLQHGIHAGEERDAERSAQRCRPGHAGPCSGLRKWYSQVAETSAR